MEPLELFRIRSRLELYTMLVKKFSSDFCVTMKFDAMSNFSKTEI
jgi:hypothetical protein